MIEKFTLIQGKIKDLPDVLEIQNAVKIIKHNEENSNALNQTMNVLGFEIESKYSWQQNLSNYKKKLFWNPIYLGSYEDDDWKPYFTQLIKLLLLTIAGLLLCLFFAYLIDSAFEYLQHLAITIFCISGSIVMYHALNRIIDALSLVKRLFIKTRKFKKTLRYVYENDDWFALTDYFDKIEKWYLIEGGRYIKLVKAFKKYKENDDQTLPDRNIFYQTKDKNETHNMIMSFQKNIECSLKLWSILSHALAYINKQMGNYEAQKNSVNIDKIKNKYIDLEFVQNDILKLKNQNETELVEVKQEILFDYDFISAALEKLLKFEEELK